VEAAVELLIGHRSWLGRGDFVGGFVQTGQELGCGTPMAWVDWPAAVTALQAGRLPCSGSEGRVLRIAASIAEAVPVELGEALSGLDETNIVRVARAVLHAGGHREAVVALAGVRGW
jgi:hypothetical protein